MGEKNIVGKIDDLVKVQSVLVSVSDKSGLEELIPALLEINPEIMILSTGGTFKKIQTILGESAKDHLVSVDHYTNQPEMQGGLVKTLDFKIYLGILSETYNDVHQQDMKERRAVSIDMVVCNLYPFEETIAKEDTTPEHARANIDVGGPCMIRGAAKNYIRIAAVVDPTDYAVVLKELKENKGMISLETRTELMKKAFAHTAHYDAAIANYWKGKTNDEIKETYEVVGDKK